MNQQVDQLLFQVGVLIFLAAEPPDQTVVLQGFKSREVFIGIWNPVAPVQVGVQNQLGMVCQSFEC